MAVCKKCFFYSAVRCEAWARFYCLNPPQLFPGANNKGRWWGPFVWCAMTWDGERGCGKDHSSYINSHVRQASSKAPAKRPSWTQTRLSNSATSPEMLGEKEWWEGGNRVVRASCSIMELKHRGPVWSPNTINKVSSPTSILLFA